MKKCYQLRLFVFVLIWIQVFSCHQIFASTIAPVDRPPEMHPLKKVLIISYNQGGGHKTAAQAVCSYLQKIEYECMISTILNDKIKGEKFFDEFFNQEKWKKLKLITSNSAQKFAESQFQNFHRPEIKKEIMAFKPSIIISVNPLANFIYKEISEKLKIPFVLIPTDLNPDTFLNKIKSPSKNSKFRLLLPIHSVKVQKIIRRSKLQNITTVSGYPVRPEFIDLARNIKQKNTETLLELNQLKLHYNIKNIDKTVMISMGAKGFGTKTVKRYIDIINQHTQDLSLGDTSQLHLIIACGSNQECFNDITAMSQTMPIGGPVVLHPEGMKNAKDFAGLMAISDFLLVKPGGATIGESITLSKRALLKSDSAYSLSWEKFNLNFFIIKKWGLALKGAHKGRINIPDFVYKFKSMLQSLPITEDFPENNFPEILINTVQELTN